MKKLLSLFFILSLMFSLCACGLNDPSQTAEPAGDSDMETISEESDTFQSARSEMDADVQQSPEEEKILIAYFTWAENNYVEDPNAVDVDATTSASVLPPGNVAQMALWIQEEVGGDMFSIRVREPYPSDYDGCLDRAADEKAVSARPELMEQVEDMSGYDTVFLGYPNWRYTAPMPVFSFLEENDLSGKKVVLFCSHGTGGLASSVQDLSAVLQGSEVEGNVIGVYRDEVSSSQDTIKEWLRESGY